MDVKPIPPEESLLKFPTLFPVKAMGLTKSANPTEPSGLAQALLEIVLKHEPDFDAASLEMRPSSAGKYLAVTATINATSRAQVDAIYLDLTAHPLVIRAL